MSNAPGPSEADAILAVVAHGLLNAMATVVGAATTLRREDLPPDAFDQLLSMVIESSDVVVEMLKDLIRGVPEDVLDALDLLGTRSFEG